MNWVRQLPFAVYSVLLSIVVGVILWATGITSDSAAILAALGLELVVTVHRVQADLRQLTDPLRGLPQGDELADALSIARTIVTAKSQPARNILETFTMTYSSRIRELSTGSVRLSPSEFMEWSKHLFGSARGGDTFFATSHLAGGEYWKQNYGLRYEKLNRDAKIRGLEIQRIFLLRDDDHLREYRHVLDRQSEFSDVWVATLDMGDRTLNLGRRDFFVYNSDLAAEFHFTGPEMELDHIQITTDRDQVRQLSEDYRDLRDSFAYQYKPNQHTGDA